LQKAFVLIVKDADAVVVDRAVKFIIYFNI